jgi:hypothetical protein
MMENSNVFKIESGNPKLVSQFFNKIADYILLHSLLQINENQYKIVEMEFYFFGENHKDGYTHDHDLDGGMWRAHNSGIDITLAGESSEYGGILLRSIKNISDNTYINGPRKVLFEIIKNLGNVFLTDHRLGLIENKLPYNYQKFEALKVNRIGLNKANRKTLNDVKYKDFPYRYIIDLNTDNKIGSREETAKNIKDPALRYQILGYNIKQ